jgi:hypothetical protein
MQKHHVLSSRRFLFFSFFELAVFSIAISADEPLLVTISKETTGITTPLKANGYPDYLGALNAFHSKGVNSNNNLAVSIWNTIGTAHMATELIAPYFEHLQIPPPPPNAKYYQSYNQWYQKTLLSQEKTSNLTPNEIDILRKSLDNEYDICILQPWTSKEFPRMARWLKSNQHFLVDLIAATLRRSRFYNPYVIGSEYKNKLAPELFGVLLPAASPTRELARGLRLLANHQIATGAIVEAITTSKAIHRLGRLSTCGASLIEGLVGIAIDRIGFSLDELIIKHEGVTDTQLQLLSDNIYALPEISKIAEKIDEFERYMFLDATIWMALNGSQSLTQLADGNSSDLAPALSNIFKGLTTTLVEWDRILRTGNYWYDQMKKVNSIRSPQQRKLATDALEKRISKAGQSAADPATIAKQVLFSGKSSGELLSTQIANVLVSLLMPTLNPAIHAETRSIANSQITLAAIAVVRHKIQHNRYPDRLSAVKGIYIDELPKDPLTGRTLKYLQNENGFLLYSFGANMTDDGGHTRADSDDGDDIVFRVEHHPRQTPKSK